MLLVPRGGGDPRLSAGAGEPKEERLCNIVMFFRISAYGLDLSVSDCDGAAEEEEEEEEERSRYKDRFFRITSIVVGCTGDGVESEAGNLLNR